MKKHDLSKATFVIPFQYENDDRIRNVTAIVNYLRTNFKTNIIVVEHGSKPTAMEKFKNILGDGFEYFYMQGSDDLFPRTTMENYAVNKAKTPVVVSQDADVVFYPECYVDSYNAVLTGTPFCYPYNMGTVQIAGEMADEFCKRLTLYGLGLEKLTQEMYDLVLARSLNYPQGGCLFMDKKAYWEAGGQNELFFNYNTEDAERHIRIKNLGYDIANTKGMLYHVSHQKTQRSTHENEHWAAGWAEFKRVEAMGREELRKYVNETFTWLNKYESYKLPPAAATNK